jgi:hypothetical protein
MLNCKLAENRDGEVDLHGTAVPESVHENDREEREWDLELTQQMRAWSERREGDRRQRTRRRRNDGAGHLGVDGDAWSRRLTTRSRPAAGST